ncbi:hypothetical protein [Odoribacter laneus]|uniref:hypothetical protein n=1 Tax=Odoribacter laneus TaxID=626933 RepID=UPI003AF6501E
MLTYEELRRINAERKKDYEDFKAKHNKRMAKLEKKEQELIKEYERLRNLVFGVTVKMTVK